ncbi:DUF6147 family protein [Sporosarcina limicola]|uniref:Uncharacterized protein n=1 Tax=Sporosarcina limicola TaxID=34101 RepID=A0A927MLP3_9BACL|nr:DUF6147 family protein [Sporosarcina limicola]MBE1556251.1 hypothetical protein [Sporosarcina limicola]
MKIINKVAILSLAAIAMMGWTAHEGLAAEKENLVFTPLSITAIDDTIEGSEINSGDLGILSTQYIMSSSSSIELLTSTTLKIGGNTKAYIPVDSISVVLYLQRWNSSTSQWVDILSIGSAKNNSSNFVSYSKNVQVVSGYYYRTKTEHYVSHNGTIEQFTRVSNQIYAN